MNGLERNIWDTFINSRDKFETALQEANDIQAKIDRMALTPEKLKMVGNEELQKYFPSLVEIIQKWWKYGSVGEDKGLIVDEKIVPLIEKNHSLSKDDAREFVMTVTTPPEPSLFIKERSMFVELCIEAASDQELMSSLQNNTIKENKKYISFIERLKKYGEKYFYARSDFYSVRVLNIMNISKLIVEQCSKTPISKLKEELAHISENINNLPHKKAVASKKITLTQEEEKYISYFSALQEWLDIRKLSMSKHFTYVFYFLMELSERTGISYDILSLMTALEIEKIMKKEVVDFEEIKSRESGYVLVYKEGGENLSYGDGEAEKLMKIISHSGVETESNIIRGNVASKGKDRKIITGKVHIINDPAKEQFNDGEILVTSMTRPEFVPIMQSAAAIITDEGGVACHAAIVSRELGIPCIIGTKIATKVLKDGDMVEVDAEKGTIRILI